MTDDVTVRAQSSFNDVARGTVFVVSRNRALALGKYVEIISDRDEKDVDQAHHKRLNPTAEVASSRGIRRTGAGLRGG